MAEKPPKNPFSVVTALPLQVPDPPRPLGPAGLALWQAVQIEYNIQDRGGIEMLLVGCQAHAAGHRPLSPCPLVTTPRCRSADLSCRRTRLRSHVGAPVVGLLRFRRLHVRLGRAAGLPAEAGHERGCRLASRSFAARTVAGSRPRAATLGARGATGC